MSLATRGTRREDDDTIGVAMEDFGTGERERLLQRFGKRLTAGQVIYREGELGSEAFLLQEGRVRLIKRVRTAERSLMVLRPGDLFGESAFIAGSPP